ncbi:hypothetical protein DFS34DRAFT_599858 [Phlyctochytrium arcticum]|nr:hypothetical protein DFS34DRAFT_599858 [Phlyctochytrium arcticum]
MRRSMKRSRGNRSREVICMCIQQVFVGPTRSDEKGYTNLFAKPKNYHMIVFAAIRIFVIFIFTLLIPVLDVGKNAFHDSLRFGQLLLLNSSQSAGIVLTTWKPWLISSALMTLGKNSAPLFSSPERSSNSFVTCVQKYLILWPKCATHQRKNAARQRCFGEGSCPSFGQKICRAKMGTWSSSRSLRSFFSSGMPYGLLDFLGDRRSQLATVEL